MRTIIFFILILCILPGCAQIGYLKDPLLDIPNFYKVDERLFRGGQPNKKGFELLKLHGIKTVVSLKGENEPVREERNLAESMGMKFYNFPMSVYAQPQDELIFSFLEIILTRENQPVFLHCESGRDRAGALVAVYRVLVYGWTPKEAYNEAKQFGFWPYHGDAKLKKFILQIKDKHIFFEKAKELIHEENK